MENQILIIVAAESYLSVEATLSVKIYNFLQSLFKNAYQINKLRITLRPLLMTPEKCK